MPRIKIETTQNVVLQTEVASLGDRVIAGIIDEGINAIYFYIIFFEIVNLDKFSFTGPTVSEILLYLALFLPSLLYHPILLHFNNGQTIGKKILNIQVISVDGSNPSIGQLAIRWICRCLDIWAIHIIALVVYNMNTFTVIPQHPIQLFPLPLLAVIMIAFTPKEQHIGDIAAGTVVIKLRKRASLSDTVFQNVSVNYKPKYTNVLKLSDYDIRAIKEAIQLAERYNNYRYAKELAIQVKKHLGVEQQVQATQFLKTIIKDYNYLANNAA